jgi:GNAT superfamily N-acetyltransferase
MEPQIDSQHPLNTNQSTRQAGPGHSGLDAVRNAVQRRAEPAPPSRAALGGRARAPAPGLADMKIEPARQGDARGVVELIGRVFAEYGWIWDPAVEVPDLLRWEGYEPPHGAFFIIRDGERVAGSVGVDRVDAGTAELHRLYLDPHLRGQGLGEALVDAILDWCRAQRLVRLVLWSDTRFEHAHRLYERKGFRRTGERELPDDVNQSREYGYERDV